MSHTTHTFVQCCNEACGWSGPLAQTVTPKHVPEQLLCPDCYEVVEQTNPCECVICCDGEHAGCCVNCAGWASVEGEECDYCACTGTCPVCEGANSPEEEPPCS